MGRRPQPRRRHDSPKASEVAKSRGGGGVCGLVVLALVGTVVFMPAKQEARLKDGTLYEQTDIVESERKWKLIIDLFDPPRRYKPKKGEKRGDVPKGVTTQWKIDWPVAGGIWGGIVVLGGLLYLLFGGRKKK